MSIIGVTGGIGSGKSAVCKIFEENGFYIIDCDNISRDITAKGSECLGELVSAFGEDILSEDGSLNRKKLASKTIENGDTKTLNNITHKYITLECKKIIEDKKSEGVNDIVIEAALLLESDVKELCDYTVAVIADKDLRVKRVMARDNISVERVLARMNSQSPDSYYIKYASAVIHNDGDEKALTENTVSTINTLRSGKNIKKTKNKKNSRPPVLRIIALIIAVLAFLFAVIFAVYSFARTAKLKSEYPVSKYTASVNKYSEMYNVPKLRIYSMIKKLSDFDAGLETGGVKKGLMQISDTDFESLCKKAGLDPAEYDVFDPDINIRCGVFCLAELYDRFENWDTVNAAYYSGYANTEEITDKIEYDEETGSVFTPDFVNDPDNSGFVSDLDRIYNKYVDIYPEQYQGNIELPGVVTHPVDRYSDIISLYSGAYEVPKSYIYSLINVESDFIESTNFDDEKIGLMQVSQSMVDEMILDGILPDEKPDLTDPDSNIKAGTAYLRYLYNTFGDYDLAVAAYSAGRDNVVKWMQDGKYFRGGKLKKTPYQQTNLFIENINKNRKEYIKLYPEVFKEEK